MAQIDAMEYWIDQLCNRSEKTQRIYKFYLLKFVSWIGKTPNQLIEMQKCSLENEGDRRENMVLESKVKEFMEYIKPNYAIGSQKLAYAAVLSFFDLNQYPLNMKRGDRPSGEGIGSRIPEKTEIVKLVNTAKSRRHRAAILLLKDSGLRISDVVRLKWDGIQDFGDGFWGWKIISQKRKVKAIPFVGPETTSALKQLKRKSDRIFPINAKTLSNAIGELIDEASLEKGLSAHGLRKFFNAELQAARVPKEWRYAMMGKKFGEYDENRHKRLFKAYREAYAHLSVYAVVEQAEEIKDLRNRYEALLNNTKKIQPLVDFVQTTFKNEEELQQFINMLRIYLKQLSKMYDIDFENI